MDMVGIDALYLKSIYGRQSAGPILRERTRGVLTSPMVRREAASGTGRRGAKPQNPSRVAPKGAAVGRASPGYTASSTLTVPCRPQSGQPRNHASSPLRKRQRTHSNITLRVTGR